jgi:hypothetical protein
MHRAASLIDILQATLRRLEEREHSDTPALAELRRNIVRAIAELEIAKSERAQSATSS